jgi:hypothetical protein
MMDYMTGDAVLAPAIRLRCIDTHGPLACSSAIIGMFIGGLGDSDESASMDLKMLAAAGERTPQEYGALPAAPGLRRSAERTTNSPQTVVEAVAA